MHGAKRFRPWAVEGLDDHHPAAATRAGARVWSQTRLVMILAGISVRLRRHSLEKLAAEPEPIGPVTVCEQAIVPDALKAAWECVQQEPAHELAGIQRHHLRLSALA